MAQRPRRTLPGGRARDLAGTIRINFASPIARLGRTRHWRLAPVAHLLHGTSPTPCLAGPAVAPDGSFGLPRIISRRRDARETARLRGAAGPRTDRPLRYDDAPAGQFRAAGPGIG